jgi:hypothetical protein
LAAAIGVSEEALEALVRNLQLLLQMNMDADGVGIKIRLRDSQSPKPQLEWQCLLGKFLYIVLIFNKLAWVPDRLLEGACYEFRPKHSLY